MLIRMFYVTKVNFPMNNLNSLKAHWNLMVSMCVSALNCSLPKLMLGVFVESVRNVDLTFAESLGAKNQLALQMK